MMGRDHVALLGLSVADPSIPWPPRGSGETRLVDREGWEFRVIPATIRGKPATLEAMCRGELAVNVMIEGEGFAICVASTGWRISHSGRVFARCVDAMRAAEAMMDGDDEWSAIQSRDNFTPRQLALGKAITGEAERRGEILLDRVFPS